MLKRRKLWHLCRRRCSWLDERATVVACPGKVYGQGVANATKLLEPTFYGESNSIFTVCVLMHTYAEEFTILVVERMRRVRRIRDVNDGTDAGQRNCSEGAWEEP